MMRKTEKLKIIIIRIKKKYNNQINKKEDLKDKREPYKVGK